MSASEMGTVENELSVTKATGGPNGIREFIRSRIYYGFVLLPYLRAKHRELLRNVERSNSHTYTCFHRSPWQLAALTGPALDYLRASEDRKLTITVFAGSNGAEAYTIASELLARRPDVEFSITASDLHQEMVDNAVAAVYSLQEISQGLHVPSEFIARTFDKVGDDYVVKPSIRSKVTFVQADLLDPKLQQHFPPADIVIAQNVLFHMPPDLARRAFESIVRFLKCRSVLFLDGMELDMRVELTKQARLKPLDFKIREIYEYSRRHIPENWWDIYYGNEPYFPLSRDKRRRYGTIFLKG